MGKKKYATKEEAKLAVSKKVSKYDIERKKNDAWFRAMKNTRSLLSVLVRDRLEGGNRQSKTLESLMGVSSEQIFNHFLNLFDGNLVIFRAAYGKIFEINHIKALSSYNYMAEIEGVDAALKEAFQLSNLDLISKHQNKKHNAAVIKMRAINKKIRKAG